jgi:hypothetical protein
MVIPCQKKSILSQRFGANSRERMEFFCAGHMHSLTYLSTIRKYYSSSSTSAYVCTRRHVGNSRKQHDIDGAKNGAKRQMLPNVGPTFSDMLPTCHPTRQCCVEIGNTNFQLTQLSQGEQRGQYSARSQDALMCSAVIHATPPFPGSTSKGHHGDP